MHLIEVPRTRGRYTAIHVISLDPPAGGLWPSVSPHQDSQFASGPIKSVSMGRADFDCRGAALIRNVPLLGLYGRPIPRAFVARDSSTGVPRPQETAPP